MDEILYQVYPELFEQMNGIISATRLLHNDPPGSMLNELAEKINDEMQKLYSSEKEVLFPFITTLAEEDKKSTSCKLFKDSKVHYTALLKLVNELKTCLRNSHEQDSSLLLPAIIDSLEVFEQQHIFLQVTKDKYLFPRFKSCSGCKTLS